MTLEQLLLSARALELSEKQANEIEHKDEKLETNALHKKRNVRRNQPRYLQDKRPEQRVNRNNKCRNCGGEFPHRGKCPAQGKSCNFCKKLNHFEKMCRSKRNTNTKRSVNTLENSDFENNFECQSKIDSSSDDEYVFGLQTESTKGTVNSIKRDQPRICVKINESNINVLIDTGSSINVIDEDTYNRMKRNPKLIATKTKVFAYGSHQNLDFVGKFDTVIETRDKLTNATVYVSKGTSGNLLCYDTSLELQIIPQISRLSTGNKHEPLCEQYKDIFHGLGKLKDTQVKIHIDNTVKPIVQPHRRIPFHVRKQVEAELERLERLDIIERVHGPTPWVSPIVVAPKPKSPGEIRICVDMSLPNQAIQRQRHITPTIDDLIVDLNGAKVFSKMDLLNGYHQLELTQESRNITTFTTHVGLRSTALEGLDGVRNISDDIIVFGASQDEHDTRLAALFQRIHENGLTLNKKKCEFNKDSLEFYGHIFSSKGISADPRKVDAIRNTNIPADISEVRSFLAMTNYVGRFIPEYSTITEPLRRLTKQGVTWTWTSEQQQSFDALKQELMNNRIMAYFDPRKATVLIVDASPVGVGALLTQDGKVNAYASRALSDVENDTVRQSEKD
ncbi:unnamed protein product [Mytilus coruscus]|uniref:Uncharacterized protein n=1 Tax=Mytilus coruscus TaxID=42192 RepID=A0A6J8AAG4_MYTCO|nr:unnamed protein product [Mytilus coruscus]